MKDSCRDEQLYEYVDGGLTDADMAEVEAHLEACAHCRETLSEIQALLSDAAALPRSIAPARDLWNDISSKIDEHAPGKVVDLATARTPWVTRWGRGVAVAALLFIGLGVFWLRYDVRVDLNGVGEATRAPSENFQGALADYRQAESAYRDAIRDLSTAYKTRRDTLPPDTRDVLDENLRIIDRAIEASRAALEGQESNPEAGEMLIAMYQKKVALLRMASTQLARKG